MAANISRELNLHFSHDEPHGQQCELGYRTCPIQDTVSDIIMQDCAKEGRAEILAASSPKVATVGKEDVVKVSQVDIEMNVYRRWCRIGSAQGFTSDTEIAVFLVQHYENTSLPSGLCLSCKSPLTLSCSRCSHPTFPTITTSHKSSVKLRTSGIQKRKRRQVTKESKPEQASAVAPNPPQLNDEHQTNDGMADTQDCSSDGLLISLPPKMTKCILGPGTTDMKKVFTCQQCSLSYTRACSLRVHMRKHTGEKPFACKLCDATFSLSASLVVHKRTHSGERPYVCEECGVAFSVSSALKQHLRKHTGERPYKCKVCGSMYSRSDSLKVHMRTHSGDKPFICEECGASFARLYCLIAHKKKHTGERPFSCTECSATFTQSGKLTIHMRKHTGDRPFQCELCGASFTQSDRLKTHMRIHTGFKPFKCVECGKAFSHPHSMKVHMRIHTGDKPYKCDFCGATFADPSYFRRHKAKHVATTTADTYSIICNAFQCTTA
ncbi:zinc finger protein OZF-like isoform X3 [Pomacea canaliculata]|uniref:zinc finger protein OZF-like isoform X3 n=1 Tax=Pomacea canaliculata TaxID=400727 RepID=UPI000D726D58|nr:zinc finger protein OZF-like isoform X3 [Pomacea canaliculata]